MAKKAGKELLVVTSKVKAFIKGKKCLTSGELPAALSDAVCCMLDGATKRAKANKRSTVKPQDL